MKTKELIAKLQALVDEHERLGLTEYMGEHETVIDIFKPIGDHKFEYAGFCNCIKIEKSSCGVYDVLSRFSECK